MLRLAIDVVIHHGGDVTDDHRYTLQYKQLYALVTEGKPVKTTAEDAAQDLKIFQMIMDAGRSQVQP